MNVPEPARPVSSGASAARTPYSSALMGATAAAARIVNVLRNASSAAHGVAGSESLHRDRTPVSHLGPLAFVGAFFAIGVRVPSRRHSSRGRTSWAKRSITSSATLAFSGT